MSQIITFVAIAAVIVIGLTIAAIFIRKYHLKEKIHQMLSDNFGMRGSFINEKRFQLRGWADDYKLTIQSIRIPESEAAKEEGNAIKFALPMVNPMRKCLRIVKEDAQHPEISNYIPLDKLLVVKHDMGDWLKINTNDLVFSSLVLSENARISVHDALKNLPHGAIMYIQDEELACIIPSLLKKEAQLEGFYKIVNALKDMKDELN